MIRPMLGRLPPHATTTHQRHFWVGLIAGLFVSVAMSSPGWAADPRGVWLIEGAEAAIEIARCGDQLCGRIAALRSPVDQSGRARRDDKNPDRTRRGERICGLVVMGGFKPAGAGVWDDGAIYNPVDGKTYSGTIALLSDNALRVQAYLGVPLFGQSQTWTRLDASTAAGALQSCGHAGTQSASR